MKTTPFSAYYLYNPLQLLSELLKMLLQNKKKKMLDVILAFLSYEMEGNPKDVCHGFLKEPKKKPTHILCIFFMTKLSGVISSSLKT